MGIKSTIKSTLEVIKSTFKEIKKETIYNYDTKESRENTVSFLLMYADGQRSEDIVRWQMCDSYYNNHHDTQEELKEYCKNNNIPWVPAIIPDPYIHVESQKNADLPDFEFSGRDDDRDSEKAKIRQYVCQYVLDNNDMLMKNNRNETRLGKLGDEMWKVGFNYNIELPNQVHGDIFIHDIDPVNFIHDPIALDIDDGEYHCYVYKLHRIKAARVFSKELKKLGLDITEIGRGETINTNIYSTSTYDQNEDTVQIVEHWFRQPTDGSAKYTYNYKGKEVTHSVSWDAGDIACSIQINDTEIKYIPLYWMKTHKQNKMYPFAMGCKIPNENKFWNKSEIEAIKELVDAEDRELASTLLNDTMCANDIIIMDENSMADGSVPKNEMGAIWEIKTGATRPVRLAGLSDRNNGLKDTINFIRDIIKQVIGNFDVNQGDAPPGNVRTLGGLVELKQQGNTRQKKKQVGTMAMWERLLKLIDYTALEFYDDDRMIFIGAEKSGKTEQVTGESGLPENKKVPISFNYNSDKIKQGDYYPVVDVTINIGDGIKNSPAMTVQTTENLIDKKITPENYILAKSLVDQMGIPDRKEIKDHWDRMFSQPPTPTGAQGAVPEQGAAPEQIAEMEQLLAEVEGMPPEQQIQVLEGVV